MRTFKILARPLSGLAPRRASGGIPLNRSQALSGKRYIPGGVDSPLRGFSGVGGNPLRFTSAADFHAVEAAFASIAPEYGETQAKPYAAERAFAQLVV